MNPTINKMAMCCTLVLGAGLWGGMAQSFKAEDKFAYEPNVACVKGSPYGKILALAMQGPIDFYWHKGRTHENEEFLGEGEDHHGHEHDAHEHGEDCDCGDHDEPTQEVSKNTDPFHVRAKHRIKEMAANAHRQTNGQRISPQHEQYLQSVTEDKLKLAYELDPSNYTNYGNYHLFLATTSYGKSDADDDKAVELAKRTLEFCKRDKVDPASWITAASAAYNVIFHIGRYYDQFTIPEAKASLAEFDYCISEYVKLRAEAIEAGRIVSEERLNEMDTRAKYLHKLRKSQGVYMKRVMSTKMANTSNSDPKVN